MSFHYRHRKAIIIISLVLIIIGVISFFSIKTYLDNKDTKKEIIKKKDTSKVIKKDIKQEEKELYKVDIKGEVVVPGIYELEVNKRVIDVIELAGGLTDNASTSVINLSKKIKDEMVIIIYSKSEVEDFSKTKEIENQVIDLCNQKDENSLINDACIPKNNEFNTTSNGKVNINTSSLEELMTLPGIGESKAKSIIEYRNNNGSFNSIEDIKNVTGIGDNLFAQIKENITT